MIEMKFEPAGVIDLLFEVEETSRPVGPMPCMDGVTDLFDSTVGLTAAGWENQITGGDDITWHGSTGMVIQEDGSAGVLGTSGSYGAFTSAYSATRTIYCLMRSAEIGTVRLNRHFIGSCAGNINDFRQGAWMSIASDQYSYGDHIGSDQWNIGVGTDVSCAEYHVAAVTRDLNGYNRIYVDGDFKDAAWNGTAYGSNWGVGLIIDDYGNIGVSPEVLQQIHFIALANAAHSAAEVAENTAWIREHILGA